MLVWPWGSGTYGILVVREKNGRAFLQGSLEAGKSLKDEFILKAGVRISIKNEL